MSHHDSDATGTDLRKAAALVMAATLVTAALVGFVRLKSLQVEAGYRVHDLRMRMVTLEQQRAALDVERAALARPQRVAHFARTVLGLTHADASLATPPPGTTPSPAVSTTTTTKPPPVVDGAHP